MLDKIYAITSQDLSESRERISDIMKEMREGMIHIKEMSEPDLSNGHKNDGVKSEQVVI